jgi:hypothetical protein
MFHVKRSLVQENKTRIVLVEWARVRALIPSPCKGEDEGEGPCAARDSFRARFRILRPFSFIARFLSLVSSRPKRRDLGSEILPLMNCLARSRVEAAPPARVRDNCAARLSDAPQSERNFHLNAQPRL